MTAQLDQTQLLDRAAALVEAARRAGADAADAVSVRRASLGIDVLSGKVEQTTRAEGDDFALRVFVGRRNASVSANVLTDFTALAERAVAMAKVAPEDPYTGLAPEDRLATELPDLDLLDESIPSVDELRDSALAAEDAGLSVTGVTKSGGSTAKWSVRGLVLATSNGFAGSYLRSGFTLTSIAIAGEGTGMERDYEYAVATHRDALGDPVALGRSAGERAVRRLNPGKIETGRYTVIYGDRESSSLLGHLAGAVNGASIARRTSFLSGDLGGQIFAPGVRVIDDPLRPRGLGSRPFDGEGVRQEAFDLVTDGVLQRWVLDSATAKELGLETNGRAARGGGNTSPSVTNLWLEPGTETPEELISQVKDGVYIIDLIGAGASVVTGDYSRGAAGFRIRNGELAEPLTEITIASNLRDMFRVMRPANDLRFRDDVNAPTIAVEGMTVAGR